MVLINKAINEVTVKLVYYGPGLCGKTTNLEKIYANPKLDNKGKMISMSTETDRTLFFDFMPMELGTIAGQKVRVQLYTVPGQVFYDATRKLVLRGADGVVFVADSQNTMRESNLDSLENLKTNLRLNRLDPEKVAVILQYNKRDLPNIDSVETMNEYMKPNGRPVVEAAAKTGTGVTATLRAAVAKILENLKNNVDTTLYDQPELAAPDMSQRSGVTGATKLSMSPSPPAPRPAERGEGGRRPGEGSHVEEENPFAAVAIAEPEPVESDPFGAVEVEPEAFADAIEDPFAETAVIHDADAERAELETMLANAQAIVASLETALERARDTEKKLAAKLSK